MWEQIKGLVIGACIVSAVVIVIFIIVNPKMPKNPRHVPALYPVNVQDIPDRGPDEFLITKEFDNCEINITISPNNNCAEETADYIYDQISEID